MTLDPLTWEYWATWPLLSPLTRSISSAHLTQVSLLGVHCVKMETAFASALNLSFGLWSKLLLLCHPLYFPFLSRRPSDLSFFIILMALMSKPVILLNIRQGDCLVRLPWTSVSSSMGSIQGGKGMTTTAPWSSKSYWVFFQTYIVCDLPQAQKNAPDPQTDSSLHVYTRGHIS